jgi:pre-mRNA-processing factor 6
LLWLAAAQAEKEKDKKSKILKKALEIIPNSEEIWQAAIEVEKEEEAKLLLYR